MAFRSFGDVSGDVFEPYAKKVNEAKVKAHNMLREEGYSFKMAGFIAEDLNEWSPCDNNFNLNKYYTTDGASDETSFFEKINDSDVADMSKTQPQTGIVKRGKSYLEKKYKSTWNFMLEKSFIGSYYLYTDMDREVTLGGQSTVMDTTVTWSVKKVKAILKQSSLSGVTLKSELCKPAGSGLIERHDIQKAAGFSKNSIEKVSDEHFRILRELIIHGGHGQNKLTRLIKGVLLCIDIASFRDGINVKAMSKDFMIYDIDTVCREYTQVKGAYFYCDKSYEHHFEIFGHLMMKAYPCKEVATDCLVEIPADGDRCIVLTQSPVQTVIYGTLTGANTWGSLLQYADDIGCSHLLERAIIIASCLRENRFLSKVMLPCVASKDELIRPCLAAKPRTSFSRGWLTPVIGRGLGRMVQCQMHMLIKDVLVASRGRKEIEADWNGMVENFFRYQKTLTVVKEETNFDVPLVRFCSEMEWISLLAREDYDGVMKVSAFETFWSMDKCKCVAKGGIVKLLKQGIYDGLTGLDAAGRKTDYQVFIDEVKLASMKNFNIPMMRGKFSVYHSGFKLKVPKWDGPVFAMISNTDRVQRLGVCKPLLLKDRPRQEKSKDKRKEAPETGEQQLKNKKSKPIGDEPSKAGLVEKDNIRKTKSVTDEEVGESESIQQEGDYISSSHRGGDASGYYVPGITETEVNQSGDGNGEQEVEQDRPKDHPADKEDSEVNKTKDDVANEGQSKGDGEERENRDGSQKKTNQDKSEPVDDDAGEGDDKDEDEEIGNDGQGEGLIRSNVDDQETGPGKGTYLPTIPDVEEYDPARPDLNIDKPETGIDRETGGELKEKGDDDGEVSGTFSSTGTSARPSGSVGSDGSMGSREIYFDDKLSDVFPADYDIIEGLSLIDSDDVGSLMRFSLLSSVQRQNRKEVLPYVSFGKEVGASANGRTLWKWNFLNGVTNIKIPESEKQRRDGKISLIGRASAGDTAQKIVKEWVVSDEIRSNYQQSKVFSDDILVTKMKKVWRSHRVKFGWPLVPPEKLEEKAFDKLVNVILDKLVLSGKLQEERIADCRKAGVARDVFLRSKYNLVGRMSEAAAFAPFQTGYRCRIEWLLNNAHIIRKAGLLNILVGFEFAVVHANIAPSLEVLPYIWLQYGGLNPVAHQCVSTFMCELTIKERVELISWCHGAMRDEGLVRRFWGIVCGSGGEQICWKNMNVNTIERFIEVYLATVAKPKPENLVRKVNTVRLVGDTVYDDSEWKIVATILKSGITPVSVRKTYQMRNRWKFSMNQEIAMHAAMVRCPDYAMEKKILQYGD